MDGIHLLGEWYGCPPDTPEFTRGGRAARRCASMRRAGAGLTVVGEHFYQFEPQGVTGTVLLAESHSRSTRGPSRLRHGRRLRLQLHDRQHGEGRAGCSASSQAALKPGAQALPGDPPRRARCLTSRGRRPPAGYIAPGRDDGVPDRRLGLLRPLARASSSASARRSRRSRSTTPFRSASCSASTAAS